MFEKSLYDLIKGLRSHKGAEKEYIDNCLRECRQEIRGSDMDLKATALLKLIYLEMFGHDLSWASFNILEVMSAAKYHQKRVGYLGAVQTFGPSTDVLMLATNLLKKDVTSANIPTISLPLVAIPHLVTPGLANAVVPDLLARMSHSSPNIRKKSITTLYRLALVWPEALRPAWPKMKEILENEDEDPSVTSTVVNVICELVWRRPEDFLPLAPRFFDLLIHGGNNWMVIKLIKLFATLTPLEPRLIKKLAPALTNLISTTPAMSVLYECINGIVQGGILDGAQGIREGDEIAELCVSKLCGMIAIDGDPNLKYVALLAFNKIVLSHPQLVSSQQDIIVSCLDDSDISIRTQALILVSGMVDVDSLMPIVGKLMAQTRQKAVSASPSEEDLGEIPRQRPTAPPPASTDLYEYQTSLAQSILDMCSRNMYANISDFDWYIDVLVQLVDIAPPVQTTASQGTGLAVYEKIGSELQNVATRVSAARMHATEASASLISALGQHELVRSAGVGAYLVLGHAAFIVGEYAGLLGEPQDTLSALLLPLPGKPPSGTLCAYIQAIPKVLSFIFATDLSDWNPQRQSMTALLLARVTHYLESYTSDENIEVQEKASTILELMRLAEAALSKHESNALTAPSLIANVIPSLFAGQELNPIAATAQEKVPVPEGLDLGEPINSNLLSILNMSDVESDDQALPAATAFYHEKEQDATLPPASRTAASQIPAFQLYDEKRSTGTSTPREDTAISGSREREPYDPFYIGGKASSGISTPVHEIIHDTNGQGLDIDSIPIMELDLDHAMTKSESDRVKVKKPKQKKSKSKAQILGDETLGDINGNGISAHTAANVRLSKTSKSRPLLGIDSSGLGSLSSSPGQSSLQLLDTAQSEPDGPNPDEEMKKALAEVERLRLEMQRAQEKIDLAEHIPEEGTMITKKKKKVKTKVKGKQTKPRSPKEQILAAQPEDEVVESYQS